jgi:hypothetical protein
MFQGIRTSLKPQDMLNTSDCLPKKCSTIFSPVLSVHYVSSCCAEYQSSFIIVRPRIHTRYNLPPRPCIFNQRPVTDLWASPPAPPFFPMFLPVSPRTHLTHSDPGFQLGDTTLDAKGIKLYSISVVLGRLQEGSGFGQRSRDRGVIEDDFSRKISYKKLYHAEQ